MYNLLHRVVTTGLEKVSRPITVVSIKYFVRQSFFSSPIHCEGIHASEKHGFVAFWIDTGFILLLKVSKGNHSTNCD